jgi:hypothetical protein
VIRKEAKIIFAVILAVIAIQSLYRVLPGIITGLVDYVTINLQILPEEKICIEFIEVPTSVARNNDLVVNGVLYNCGSVQLGPTLRMSIMSGASEVSFETVSAPNIVPGESQPFVYTWNARNKPGDYEFRIRAYYNGMQDFDEASSPFTITGQEDTDEARVEPGASIDFTLPVADLEVEYPQRLNLTQDSEYTILIKATNVGDLTLHNISLELVSEDLQVTIINPEAVDLLDPDSAIIYIVRARVPVDLGPGSYRMSWKISSDELQRVGIINVDVLQLSDKERAKQLIDYYSGLIDTVQDEIDRVREIKNVTGAEVLLNEAREELNAAKDLYRIGLYTGALEQLEMVRNKVEDAIIALSKAEMLERGVITILRAVPSMACIIWLVVSVVSTSVSGIILTFKTKMEWKRILFIMACIGLVIILASGFRCWFIMVVAIALVILIFWVLKPWKRRFEFYRFEKW